MTSGMIGACIKRHRGGRSQQVLADSLGRSLRWVAYVEAGTTVPDWQDLADIANVLGSTAGTAFLDEAVMLLYEEVEVERAMKQVRD
jgi:transcriptional regulator with XRE-family HTH domain